MALDTHPGPLRNFVIFSLKCDSAIALDEVDKENRPIGISHFGIHVENRNDAMTIFSGRGASPTNTRIGLTGAVIADIFDPDGIRIEISEYPANSLQGKALAGEL